jgi:aminopeptidase N
MHAWAAAWLRTTGVDTFTPEVTGGTGTWALEVRHTGERPLRMAIGLYDPDSVDPELLVRRTRWERDFPAGGGATRIPGQGARPALVLLNDQDLTYAKVRLDPDSWASVVRGLPGVADPLARTVVWNAARDMVRDGELAPAAYLDTVRAHLPHESDLALVRGVLGFASAQVVRRYLPDDARAGGLALLADLGRDLLRRTEDGERPGLRLTAVRHLVACATQPDTLAAWLADGSVPGGPEIDTELRWQILVRLAVLGAVDDGDIAGALEADPGSLAQEGAARARAAFPDAGAKRRAWERLFPPEGGEDLSNYLFTATAQGFWQPEQQDLLRSYVPRYYPAAVAVAARRGPAIAKAAAAAAFPVYAVDEETLRLGEQCLAGSGASGPVPALRRGLADQLDDLARALRVRAAAARS